MEIEMEQVEEERKVLESISARAVELESEKMAMEMELNKVGEAKKTPALLNEMILEPTTGDRTTKDVACMVMERFTWMENYSGKWLLLVQLELLVWWQLHCSYATQNKCDSVIWSVGLAEDHNFLQFLSHIGAQDFAWLWFRVCETFVCLR
ncbi:hypothetical protein ISN44_As09g028490 [Arabidopsis suecica]|uniref:Uncharacterized protein n=1 Tax=Arabidopsis suecica TaxID=45249 RepID=A0A8T2ALG6_ARASU|nr:hypothetical protein ISN44_As09g028490 [Arabidopsis suecica]